MVFSISANQIIKQLNFPLLASIGFHGIFFALILPQWNPRDNFKNNQALQNTPVIELNQLEQTRIPSQNPNNNFNWNILNALPEGNNQNLAFNFPENSLPTVQLSPLPLPQGDNNFSSLPPLPPPPTSFSQNNSSSYQNNSSNFPLPNYQIDSSMATQLPPPPNMKEDFTRDIVSSLPVIQDTDLPNNNQQITTTIETSPEEEARIRQQIFANSPIQITANPRDVINGKSPQFTEDDFNLNNVNNKPAIVNSLPQNYQSLASKLEKNTENTTDEEARKNYVSWAAEVKNVQPKEINLTGIYPKDACVRKLEGTTTYGVTVNPQGSVINTQLIKSSGYNLFNNQALTQIKNYKFANNSDVSQPYHVYVNFNYSNQVCPSVSINNLGNIPSQSPVPSPNNKQEKQTPNDTTTNQNNTSVKSNPNQQSAPESDTQSPSNKPTSNTNSVSTPKINLPNKPNNNAETLVIPTQTPPSSNSTPEESIVPQSSQPKPDEESKTEKSSAQETILEN
jgi:TonB family protein